MTPGWLVIWPGLILVHLNDSWTCWMTFEAVLFIALMRISCFLLWNEVDMIIRLWFWKNVNSIINENGVCAPPQVSLTRNCQPPRRSGRAAQMQTIFIALLFFPFYVGALSMVAYTAWRYSMQSWLILTIIKTFIWQKAKPYHHFFTKFLQKPK